MIVGGFEACRCADHGSHTPVVSITPRAVQISREEEGDEGEYAVVRALGFKVRVLLRPQVDQQNRCVPGVCSDLFFPVSQDHIAQREKIRKDFRFSL